MGDDDSKQDLRQHPRITHRTKLKIKLPDFAKFIEKYSGDMSEGGMFICSKNPKPPGSIIIFEFMEKGESRILAGEGVVKWMRTAEQGNEGPSGMGVQFTKLTRESIELIKKIVAQKPKPEKL